MTRTTQSRLYDFFVTDDSARYRAYLYSMTAASAVAVMLTIAGGEEIYALSISALTALISMALLTAKYVKQQSPVDVYRFAMPRERRSMLKLIGASGATATIDAALATVSSPEILLPYASQVAGSLRAGGPILFSGLGIMRTAAAGSLQRHPSDQKLMDAVAVLTFASQLKTSSRKVVSIKSIDETALHPDFQLHDFTLRLTNGGGFVQMSRGGTGIIENVRVEGLPWNFGRGIERPDDAGYVLVKRFSMFACHQVLDFIAWLDTEFEMCELTVKNPDTLLLINATFTNCTVTVLGAEPIPDSIRHGDGKGVTFIGRSIATP